MTTAARGSSATPTSAPGRARRGRGPAEPAAGTRAALDERRHVRAMHMPDENSHAASSGTRARESHKTAHWLHRRRVPRGSGAKPGLSRLAPPKKTALSGAIPCCDADRRGRRSSCHLLSSGEPARIGAALTARRSREGGALARPGPNYLIRARARLATRPSLWFLRAFELAGAVVLGGAIGRGRVAAPSGCRR